MPLVVDGPKVSVRKTLYYHEISWEEFTRVDEDGSEYEQFNKGTVTVHQDGDLGWDQLETEIMPREVWPYIFAAREHFGHM